jgi:hypothetical protein
MTIPASKLVRVTPGVISAGGSALALSGLILTADPSIPLGTVQNFATPAAVTAQFGGASPEAAVAAIYFAGYDNSTQKPANLLFAQYPTAAVAAYLRSANISAMTLAQLNAITAGIMTVTMDGVLKTSSSINLGAATSFSNAATIITAAFTSGPTFTYDTQRGAFLATSATTGAASTMTFAAGAIATALSLTAATGAVLSQGAIAATPAAAMTAITAVALNWAGFMTMFEPLLADKINFGTWATQQGDRFVYAAWDTDANAVVANNTTAFGPQAVALALSGTVPLSADPAYAASIGSTVAALARPLAAAVLGYMASLDFGRTNGRATLAYRSFGGVAYGVGDATVAANLQANGYNFYGAYATSQQSFINMQDGHVVGRFAWLDSYVNQIKMNADFQQTLMTFAANSGSIPYNSFGYSAIESVLQDPINKALNFGGIRAGVTLSSAQIVAVNAAAGKTIDTVLSSRGWYLDIRDPGASVRVARGSPQMTFYYCDGGSVQSFALASLLVQ